MVLTEWLGDDTIDLERAIRSRALYRRDRKSLDGMRRASAADDENDTPTDMSVTATRCLALAVMLQIAEAATCMRAACSPRRETGQRADQRSARVPPWR